MSGGGQVATIQRRRPWFARWGLLLGICALLLLMAAPLGHRLDIVDRGTALGALPRYAAYAGIVATSVSLLGIVMSIRARRRGWIVAALVGCLAGSAAAYLPWAYIESVQNTPNINDITTDTDNPPTFETLARVREAAHAGPSTYGGPDVAAKQRLAYPYVEPLHLELSPVDAFARTLEQVRPKAGPWRQRIPRAAGSKRVPRRSGTGSPTTWCSALPPTVLARASTCARRAASGAATAASTPLAFAAFSRLSSSLPRAKALTARERHG